MRFSNQLRGFGPALLAAAVLLAGSTTAAYAQNRERDKNKSSESHPSHPAPQHPAPQHPAPQHSAPPQAHSVPPPQQHSAPPQAAPSRPAPQTGGFGGSHANGGGATPNANGGNPNGGNGRTFGNPSNTGNTRPGGVTPNTVPNNRQGNSGGNAPNGVNGGRTGIPGNNGNTRPPNATGNPNNTRPAYTPGNRPTTPNAVNNSGRPGMNPPPGGRVFGSNNTAGRPPVVTRTPNGGVVRHAPDGRIQEVRTPSGAVIRHTPGGYRQVEVVRPGGRVVVARPVGGYVQRPVVVRGTTYVQRTYIVSGRPVVRVYNPYRWGGLSINIYRPVRYYPPAYYSWAYTPWVRPVHWGWGWGIGTPWYGYYGGWFTPYPVYSSPAFWLTDYLMATTLEAAYQERMASQAQAAAANNANYAQTPLTPDVKQAISDEVKRQLDQERAEQQNANYQPALFGGGNTHVFVVSTGLDVMSTGGECVLTEGDVLQLNGALANGAESGQVVVMASKGNDCRKGSMVNVGVADLQEMQNQMRATLDNGLEEMRTKQGQGEMPRLPPQAAAPVQQASYAAEMQPDAAANSEIQQASQEAERSEQEVVNQAASTGSTGAPVTISLGQTTAEVVAVLGQPARTANLGAKQIYFYNDMKVTFTDGKVTDVQ